MMRLHSYWRSGAAHRVRIALALKNLPYETLTVNLAAGAQREDAYRALNPQMLAPALEVDGAVLTQSPAILEWLEETYPDPPLLPADAMARAKVRAMAAAVACEIHPLGNLRVLQDLRQRYGADDASIKDWALRWIGEGLTATEALAQSAPAGAWAWGDTPTLADCMLVPQIYAAISRYGYEIDRHPRLAALYAASLEHPAFLAAHPERQPGAPRA